MTIPRDIRWLLGQLRPFTTAYLIGIALTLVVAVLSILDPLVIRLIIDDVLPARNYVWLLGASAGVVLILFSRLVVNRVGTLIMFRANQRMVLRMRLELLRHLNRQSAGFFDRAKVGDISLRVEEDIGTIGDVVEQLIVGAFRTIVFSLLSVTILALLNLTFTCIVFPLIPAFILVRRRYVSELTVRSKAVREKRGQRGAFLNDYLLTIMQVQLLRRQRTQVRRFAGLEVAAMRAQEYRKRMELTYGVSSMVPAMLAAAVLLAFGGYQVTIGAFTIGGLVASFSYLMRLFDPLASVVAVDTAFYRMRASVQRVLDILDERPMVSDPANGVVLNPSEPARLTFDDVSFEYEAGRVALQHVSFTIAPGEKIALVGRSGSGKSTIAMLAARLYDVRAGAIRINDSDIRDLKLESLRSVVSLLPQRPMLLTGTIRENLLYGKPDADQESLEEAAAIAQVRGVICGLPFQWDQEIGPRGGLLSGGEHQRIALARTLLQPPRILILDECTSAVDAPTESRILKALREYSRDITVMAISHRVSTMSWADRVILVDGGQIVAQGSHQDLTATCAVYREICREQLRRDKTVTSPDPRDEVFLGRTALSARLPEATP